MATEIVEFTPAPNATEDAAKGLDEFAALEAKITRIADALLQARAERDQAREDARAERDRAAQAAHALQALQSEQRASERELVALRKERIEIRNRVTRLTKHLTEHVAADA